MARTAICWRLMPSVRSYSTAKEVTGMTTPMSRLSSLRARFAAKEIDALIVAKPHNVAYLSGFTGTAGLLLVTGDAAYLITDFRYVEQAAAQTEGFEIVRQDVKGAVVNLSELLSRHRATSVGFEGDFVTHDIYQAYCKEFQDSRSLVAVSGLIESIRMIKDEQEIAVMRKAAQIADEAFQHILSVIEPGLTERKVSLELEYSMKKAGAEGLAFDIIVASGARSALPHGIATDKAIRLGDLVTMDFGALFNGYCSDMTRTVMIGEPTEEQRQIYAIVLEAQLRGVAAARPGMTGRELDAVCRDYIVAHGYGDKFGHSTGHGVGRYIHEGPRVSALGEERLQPGMVVTIEPGIYLPGWGGVRIEDMVLITADGCERLSQSAKELIILE